MKVKGFLWFNRKLWLFIRKMFNLKNEWNKKAIFQRRMNWKNTRGLQISPVGGVRVGPRVVSTCRQSGRPWDWYFIIKTQSRAPHVHFSNLITSNSLELTTPSPQRIHLLKLRPLPWSKNEFLIWTTLISAPISTTYPHKLAGH